jgi:hypothetical protein
MCGNESKKESRKKFNKKNESRLVSGIIEKYNFSDKRSEIDKGY